VSPNRFELLGLDGTNPLGFLAALGTLVTLEQARQGGSRLWWKRQHTWIPVLEGAPAADEHALAQVLADDLRGRPVDPEADQQRAAAQKGMEDARTALKKKREEIKKRQLTRAERAEVGKRELPPLEDEYRAKRQRWLEALRLAVPRPELALGKRLDCTPEEYREHAAGFLERAGYAEREALDLLAAFGSDACRRRQQRDGSIIQPTPFCFISGSGNQEFLETARQLVGRVSTERLQAVLFQPWRYRDPKLSMRWDPVEDKRYALTDVKPADEGASTEWMANLLAYRAHALFPTAPTSRGLGTAGWIQLEDWEAFTWPLWQYPATLDTVRSLVQLAEWAEEDPDTSPLRARGIAAVYRAQRIEVGAGSNRKINFAPARQV
jgi:hypothetical protein